MSDAKTTSLDITNKALAKAPTGNLPLTAFQ
jgi:hypothetical protein